MKRKEIENIVKVLDTSAEKYYSDGSSDLTDEEYDKLLDRLRLLDPDNEYFERIGHVVRESVDLPMKMTSVNKKDPETFAKKYPGPYNISDKLDGISALVSGGKMYTRGDGSTGKDITRFIRYIFRKEAGCIDELDEGEYVRGELIISKERFASLPMYKNARNAVAGIINGEKIEYMKYIDFVGYSGRIDILPDSMQVWNKVYRSLDSLPDILKKRRTDSPYVIDGVVVRDMSFETDMTSVKNPDHMFAFKQNIESEMTKVVEIIWNPSIHRKLKPVLVLEPVHLGGVTISRVTAYHARYILDNGIGPGTILLIERAGEVIPHIKRVIKGSRPTGEAGLKWLPKGKLEGNDLVVVLNDEIRRKRIRYFFETIGVTVRNEDIRGKTIIACIRRLDEKYIAKLKNTISDEQIIVGSLIFGEGVGAKKIAEICRIGKDPRLRKFVAIKKALLSRLKK